ncbi:MAG: N-acetyltransferase, partial [Kutzneria sp.]|nr:N-acetyltransferase [Kutzneria sp.]
ELLGYALAAPWKPKPAYRHTIEVTIYLAPAHTGRGYGRRLLDELLARCAATGLRQAVAVIADTGEPASLALHNAAGFTLVGRLREVGHKHGRWVDTVLMQRELSTSAG